MARSAGVVLYIMVVGKFPFESPNIISLFTNIARGKFSIPDWIGPELMDLLKGILQVDPDKRFSLTQIKKHLWMKLVFPKDRTPSITIDPITSLFGHDEKTLNHVLEELQNRNGEKKGSKESFDEESYETGSEMSDPSSINQASISDESETSSSLQEEEKVPRKVQKNQRASQKRTVKGTTKKIPRNP